MTRFKAYENAAHEIRIDKKNTVQTRIRSGTNDFYLLVRNKGSSDSWNNIQKTPVPVDMDASFDAGKLSPEDDIKEKEYLKQLANHNSLKKNDPYKSNNIQLEI